MAKSTLFAAFSGIFPIHELDVLLSVPFIPGWRGGGGGEGVYRGNDKNRVGR